MRIKPLLIASAAVAIALPALAQQMAQSQPANQYPNGGIGATQAQPQAQPSTAPSAVGLETSGGTDETAVE
jgi:hypothetical protein